MTINILRNREAKDLSTVDRLNNAFSDGVFFELKFNVLRFHPGCTTGKPEILDFPRSNVFYYMLFKRKRIILNGNKRYLFFFIYIR